MYITKKYLLILLFFGLISIAISQPALKDEQCVSYKNCEDCVNATCTWAQCKGRLFSCLPRPKQMCPMAKCDMLHGNTTTMTTLTTNPSEKTTTTIAPTPPDTTTTTRPTDPTTSADPATTADPTTTAYPTTSTETTTPTDSTTPTDPTIPTNPTPPTNSTTTTIQPPTTPQTTTAAPSPPHGRHFDAASFIGGILLVLSSAGLAYGGVWYYRRRFQRNDYGPF